jgi:hypothetical protein
MRSEKRGTVKICSDMTASGLSEIIGSADLRFREELMRSCAVLRDVEG